MKRFLSAIGLTLLVGGSLGLAFLFGMHLTDLVQSPSKTQGMNQRVEQRPSANVLEKETLNPGIDHISYTFNTSTGATIELFGFDPSQVHVRMLASSTPQTVEHWFQDVPSALAVINGVYFKEDMKPAGLLVIQGKGDDSVRFDLDKSGLMVLGDRFEIIDTAKEQMTLETFTDAAQSYPFLIKKGAPSISEDSGRSARRSFIGTDQAGKIWLGILPNDAVSLYELAQALPGTGIAWKDVLNLDGGPSSGLEVRGDEKRRSYPSYIQVPNVIVIEPR